MILYLQPHLSQYRPGASQATRSSGCTWTSGANGIAAVTGGAQRPKPDAIHALVAKNEETDPLKPGWSMGDLELAMHRFGVGFHNRSGQGWNAVVEAHESGHYIALQGDSDQFGNETCSGAFDGPHCIGVHPKSKAEGAVRWWWIDDPICRTARWERQDVLKRYATKLGTSVFFGVFTQVVPAVGAPLPPAQPVVVRFGGRPLARPVAKPIRVAAGRKANVRTAPRTSAVIAAHRANGETFTASQVTDHGQLLAGSSRWYGDRTGTRWVHSSSF